MVVGSPIVLNLIPGGVMPVIMINETDKGYQKEFLIYNGNTPYNVPANVSATIRGTKRDGLGVTEAAEVTAGSNVVRITVTEQMTAVPGKNIFELVFVDTNGLRVATINFIMLVERSALNANTVISESDISYAEQVLNQLQSVAAFKEQLDNASADIIDLQAQKYNTCIDMRASTTLKSGMIVQTAGYYAINDGGAALYYVMGSAPVEDYYETLQNGLIAILIHGGVVTPEVFGAYGDGTHNDSVAVQRAINSNAEEIVFSKSYLLQGITISAKKYLRFLPGCSVIPVYYDNSKNIFHNIFSTSAEVVFDGLNVTGENTGITVSQSRYSEPIILGTSGKVIIKNSVFKDLYFKNRGSSPSSTNDRRGIVLTMTSGDFVIDNCVFDNLNDEEWIQCMGAYTGEYVIKNSRFLNGTGFSRITVQCDTVTVSKCEFTGAVYRGSLCNLLGKKVYIIDNYVHECDVDFVFDASESRLYSSDYFYAAGNVIINEQTSGAMGFNINCGKGVIENNCLKGRSLCIATNTGATLFDVDILNNTIEINAPSLTASFLGIVVNNMNTEFTSAKCVIKGNSISQNKNNVNSYIPILIRNIDTAVVDGNKCYLGKQSGTSSNRLGFVVDEATIKRNIEVLHNTILFEPNNTMDSEEYTQTRLIYMVGSGSIGTAHAMFNYIQIKGTFNYENITEEMNYKYILT